MTEVIEEIMKMIEEEERRPIQSKPERTWYCVVSSYYNDGHVTAGVVGKMKASERPRGSYTETRDKDVYTDWFGSPEEAREHVEACLNA